jgi:hypothetical protein
VLRARSIDRSRWAACGTSGREAEAYLARLRDLAIASGPTVFAVAAMLVGAFLVFDGVIGLTGS